jgi:hypothetical protein
MSRRLTDSEIGLLRKLAGPAFPQLATLEEQSKDSVVSEIDNGHILEFQVFSVKPLDVTRTVLGEGSLYDVDGVPIIFTLLQKGGYIWRLDITKADSGRIVRELDYGDVNALGYGRGLSLERRD